MDFKIGKINKCTVCGKEDTEGLIVKGKIFKIFTVNVEICQKCISKAFRSFKKGK